MGPRNEYILLLMGCLLGHVETFHRMMVEIETFSRCLKGRKNEYTLVFKMFEEPNVKAATRADRMGTADA